MSFAVAGDDGPGREQEGGRGMRGPTILARTLSISALRGRSPPAWQYHSRSDSHSKVACWAVLFDLMLECEPFRRDAKAGKVGYGINHVMVGPINKTLDLVVTLVPPGRHAAGTETFAQTAERFGIALSEEEHQLVASMPPLALDKGDDSPEPAIALEAKACMTEHVKSLPRLHAEILATGYLAKRAAPGCITVSYTLVNSADFFLSPSGRGRRNTHRQPDDAARVVEMIRLAVPTRADSREYGYDVVGVSVIACRNDGSTVNVVDGKDYGLGPRSHLAYEQMIRNLCGQYRDRFGRG